MSTSTLKIEGVFEDSKIEAFATKKGWVKETTTMLPDPVLGVKPVTVQNPISAAEYSVNVVKEIITKEFASLDIDRIEKENQDATEAAKSTVKQRVGQLFEVTIDANN